MLSAECCDEPANGGKQWAETGSWARTAKIEDDEMNIWKTSEENIIYLVVKFTSNIAQTYLKTNRY